MFDRWRYHGRHRGVFLDRYRSAEALAAAQRWYTIQDIPPAEPWHIAVAGQVLIRDYVPAADDEPPLWIPVGHEPTIVFNEPCRRDHSGLSLWNLEQLAADLDLTWPQMTVKLWLRGDELDDDDKARYDRLMGMAGA